MPRLGKIRLGIKAKNAKGVEYPKDVDYFVCPPEVQAIHGEKPKEIPVLIPSSDPALYFPQALKWYKGARLVCKGNGETATRINEQTGEMFEMKCPCDMLRDSQTNPKGPCTPRACLMLILPEVSMGGAYQLDTGSMNNIINLNSTLKWIESFLGRVAWVPLLLKRTPQKIQTPDGTTTKALVSLEFRGNAREAAALRKMDWIAIQGGTVPAALPPHVGEEDEPPADVVEDVDETTGEIVDATPDKNPPNPPENVGGPEPVDLSKSTPPAAEEDPFPDPEPEKPPYQEPPEIEHPAPAPAPAPAAPPPGPFISTAKVNILRALFTSKGIKDPNDQDIWMKAARGYDLAHMPMSRYNTDREVIFQLPAGMREPGADENEG